MPKYTRTSLLAAMIASTSAGAVQAADQGPLDASFIIDAGGFFLSTDTRVRVNGETSDAIGSDIDFDDTFGLGDFDRFRVDVKWRFAERHSLRAMYFENDRSGSREIERDIVFGDETFPVGVRVEATSELTVAQLSYDYAFMRTERYEVAGGIGLHMLDAELGLEAEVTSSGASASRRISEGASTQAPLPVVGLRGLWRLSDSFYVTAAAQYFYVEIDAYSGSITDLNASIVWEATRHVGLGVGYNDFRLRFDIDDEGDFDGRLRWSYGGAIAFISVMF